MNKKMDIFNNNIPENIILIHKILTENGFELFLVGGSIRNLIHNMIHDDKLDIEFDYDFATNAKPEEIMKLFNFQNNNIKVFTVPTGINHGTISVFISKNNTLIKNEITTYRTEKNYSDSRHPDKVEFVNNIENDLKRRDFTINALAYNIERKEVMDLFDGINDIKKRIIKTVGNPEERFNEDGLRPIRACRLAAQMNYIIDDETLNFIPKVLDTVKKISIERFRDEFLKLLKSKKPSIGIEYMRKTGILEIFIPELLEGYGVMQNEFHKFDIYYHNIYSCDAAETNDPILKLAILFHDIGKPRAKKYSIESGNGNVFYNHEIIGEKMTEKILKRLKFGNNDINRVLVLVRQHMFYYTDEWTDGAVRRFLRKINGSNELLNDLFILRKADRIGSGTKEPDANILEKFKTRIKNIMDEDNALKVTDLKVNGYDIMKHFNLKPSKTVGIILEYLLEKVLDNPELNDKNILLKLGEEFLSKYNIDNYNK